MRSGFFAVLLDEESRLQTAFWWRGKLYAFNRLPSGHVNATAIFQRRMELELQQSGLAHTLHQCVCRQCLSIYTAAAWKSTYSSWISCSHILPRQGSEHILPKPF
jgi:hypothetical protein